MQIDKVRLLREMWGDMRIRLAGLLIIIFLLIAWQVITGIAEPDPELGEIAAVKSPGMFGLAVRAIITLVFCGLAYHLCVRALFEWNYILLAGILIATVILAGGVGPWWAMFIASLTLSYSLPFTPVSKLATDLDNEPLPDYSGPDGYEKTNAENMREPEISSGAKRVFMGIVTAGAHERVRSKLEEYRDRVAYLKGRVDEMETRRRILGARMEQLIQDKVHAANLLKRIHVLSDGVTGKAREFNNMELKADDRMRIERIETTVSAGEVAAGAISGVGSGVATVAGSWALVGAFGSASTGTAINTLGGAAAYNATLAWFSGGALSAGGGGMAGGTMVLGGVVAVPALLVFAAVSHLQASKKIKKIEEQLLDLLKHEEELEKTIIALELMEKRVLELRIAIRMSANVFQTSLRRTYWLIYPLGTISKLNGRLRHQFYSDPVLNQRAYSHLSSMLKTAKHFADIIEQPVMSNEGAVYETKYQVLN